MAWLECSHDGHHLCDTLGSYTKLRRKHGASRRDDAALWQSAMTFGLLEAAFNIRIPEDFLLSRGGNKRKVLTSDMMSILVFDWLIRFLAVQAEGSAVSRNVVHSHPERSLLGEQWTCGGMSRAAQDLAARWNSPGGSRSHPLRHWDDSGDTIRLRLPGRHPGGAISGYVHEERSRGHLHRDAHRYGLVSFLRTQNRASNTLLTRLRHDM